MEPYQEDAYCYEFETTISSVQNKDDETQFVTLEKSYFYPNSGGQPHDLGTINNSEVIFVGKFNGKTSHEVKGKFQVGDKVICKINEERRSRLRRSHTAAHIISAVIHNKTGAEITGNQLSTEKIRIDFSTPNYDPEAFKNYVEEANNVIDQAIEVSSTEINRKEVSENSSLFKLAKGFPDHIKILRIVSIGDFDQQACGGTHVSNTKEIGKLELIKVENKGSKNRRVYLKLLD